MNRNKKISGYHYMKYNLKLAYYYNNNSYIPRLGLFKTTDIITLKFIYDSYLNLNNGYDFDTLIRAIYRGEVDCICDETVRDARLDNIDDMTLKGCITEK